MQQSFSAGDTLKIEKNIDGFPSMEFGIAISLRAPGSAIDIKEGAEGVTIAHNGTGFLITVSSATTKTWKSGCHSYAVYMIKGDERYTVEVGHVEIKPDIEAQTDYDGRSHVKKVLDAIEAVIEKRASNDQMSYTIAGRSLSRIPIPELLKLRDVYRIEYNREMKAADIARGEYRGGMLKVRF